MKQPDRAILLKTVAAAVFGLAFPIVLAIALRASLSPILIVLFPLVKVPLYLAAVLSAKPLKRVFQAGSWFASLVFAVLVLIGVLITPYSSYRIWLESVQYDVPSGNVSNLIVLIGSFFASHLAGLFFTMDFLWPFLGLLLVASAITVFVYQTLGAFLFLALAITACLVYLLFKYGQKWNRLRGFFSFANLAIITLLVSIIVTGSGAATGNRMIDTTLYPFLRGSVLDAFPGFPLVYAVPGFGFSFDETKHLGGKPILSPVAIFEIENMPEAKLYLRTRAYDYYDGKTWKVYRLPKRANPGGALVYSKRRNQNELSLKLVIDYYSLLPHTLDTTRIRFERRVPDLQYGNWNLGYVLSNPIKRGETIHLQRGEIEVPDSLPNKDRYLQLPDDLPQEIRFLAERMGAAAEDEETILRRIQSYLAINYSYDLEAEMYGEYEDFATSFLFGQLKGYCVHFATSFVILARLNDIPTRYTTGFLVIRPTDEETSIVSGLSSHAWPEVWLENKGWTSYEATPALNPAYYSQMGDYWLYGLDMEFRGLTERQITSIMGPVRMTGEPDSEFTLNVPPVVFFLAGGILFIVLAVVLIRKRLPAAPDLNRPREQRIFFGIMGKMVTSLEKQALDSPTRTGWLSWRDGFATRLPSLSRSIERVTAIVLQTVYGRRHLHPRDIEYARLFYKKMKSERRALRNGLSA